MNRTAHLTPPAGLTELIERPLHAHQSAAAWLIGCTPLLQRYRLEDSFLAGDIRDAALMRSLARHRYYTPQCREMWRRAFVGLAFEDMEHGTIDMSGDERQFSARHDGSNRSWSGD